MPVKNVNEVHALKNLKEQNNSSGIAKQRPNIKRTAQQVSDDERICRLCASLSPDMKKQFLAKMPKDVRRKVTMASKIKSSHQLTTNTEDDKLNYLFFFHCPILIKQKT